MYLRIQSDFIYKNISENGCLLPKLVRGQGYSKNANDERRPYPDIRNMSRVLVDESICVENTVVLHKNKTKCTAEKVKFQSGKKSCVKTN